MRHCASSSGSSEHALEDRIDVPEMMVEIKICLQILFRELGPNVLVGLKQRKEIALAAPNLHGVALNETIGVFARNTFFCKRDEYALRMNEPAKPIEVLLHDGWVDNEFVDD